MTLLWEAQVDVFTPTDRVLGTWLDWEALRDTPGVVEPGGFGLNGDGYGGAHVDVRFRIRAADEAAAKVVVDQVVERELKRAGRGLARDPRLEVAVALRQILEGDLRDNEVFVPGWVPDRLEPATWDSYRPTDDDRALLIVSMSFPLDIGKVEVDEALDRVTVTVHDLYPGFEREEDVHEGVAAMGVQRRVLVRLSDPLAGRPVFDGTLRRQPADVRPSNAHNHGRRPLATEAELGDFDFKELGRGGKLARFPM